MGEVTVWVVGAGRAGLGLARAVQRAEGLRLMGLHDRDRAVAERASCVLAVAGAVEPEAAALASADVLLLCVPDRAIRVVCRELVAAGELTAAEAAERIAAIQAA